MAPSTNLLKTLRQYEVFKDFCKLQTVETRLSMDEILNKHVIERSCERERKDLDIFFWILLKCLPKYCFLSHPVSHILIYSKSNGLLVKR